MVSYNILFKRDEPYLFIQLNLVQIIQSFFSVPFIIIIISIIKKHQKTKPKVPFLNFSNSSLD